MALIRPCAPCSAYKQWAFSDCHNLIIESVPPEAIIWSLVIDNFVTGPLWRWRQDLVNFLSKNKKIY